MRTGTFHAPLGAAIFTAALLTTAQGQDAPPPTIRVSVDRIQIGALVTDAKGSHVTDLGLGDFTILDGGKRQEVTNCEYIRVENTAAPTPASAAAGRAVAMPDLPNRELTRDQVRRSIVFLVDDNSFAPTVIPDVRKALQSTIERNLESGDMAAIMRTSSGSSSLEQFTSDKRVLLESVGKIRWRPESRANPGMLPQISGYVVGEFPGNGANVLLIASEKRTVDVLHYVTSALRDLPGRKALFLISQSFPAAKQYSNPASLMPTEIGKLVDEALRAGVVVYCLDPTPLSSLTPDAAYDVTSDNLAMQTGMPGVFPQRGVTNRQAATQLNAYTPRALGLLELYRSGLRALAEGTGGQIAQDTDMQNALARFSADLEGYYLLTYRPTNAEKYFNGRRGQPPFRNVKVNVTRAGLHVRSYAGYIAQSDHVVSNTSDASNHVRTLGLGRAVSAALFSPFAAGGLHVDLYPAFTLPEPMSPELRMLVHIDAHDLTFRYGDDGRHNADLELVARAGGDRDEPGDVVSKEVVLHLKDESFAEAMRVGLTYPVAIAAQHPGLYDVRAAVRDTASKRVGSARGFVEVPDLLNGRLAVSGVLLHNGTDELHQFHREDSLSYMCRVFHAKSVKGEVRIVRDSGLVFAVPAMVVVNDGGSVTLQGVLPLMALAPGLYSLQVVATEDGGTDAASSQWTDFEIVN
jgi:VWFA-related protein